ncbi:MAG: hypothetical protein A2Z24_00840 [Candidatus Woykebacteria bacterium RBG_16_44_10]|uniref:Uncharacterized protein n=1 Tax=Candidatus Woykebacteria bacterium RBG_16_44_10 TaxID=1802597 RepID=A0A1G1WFL4_9BACT|nr:MAG: hypothetical protein A2Z24_00840 [Candidatus Woykebacteria bacterium RBG_16_44_10]
MNETYIQAGAIGAIFIFFVKEFFQYLKSKNGNGSNGFNKAIFDELKKMNSNHLHSIEETLRTGNERLVDAINTGNGKTLEILSEIRGRLSR